jgi:hypothetical protein
MSFKAHVTFPRNWQETLCPCPPVLVSNQYTIRGQPTQPLHTKPPVKDGQVKYTSSPDEQTASGSWVPLPVLTHPFFLSHSFLTFVATLVYYYYFFSGVPHSVGRLGQISGALVYHWVFDRIRSCHVTHSVGSQCWLPLILIHPTSSLITHLVFTLRPT